MNVVFEVRFDARPLEVLRMRPPAMRTQNDVDTGNGNDSYDDRALKQISFLHNISAFSCRTERQNAHAARAAYA